jgi:hypothetical protein
MRGKWWTRRLWTRTNIACTLKKNSEENKILCSSDLRIAHERVDRTKVALDAADLVFEDLVEENALEFA